VDVPHTKIAIGSPNETHKISAEYEEIIHSWADANLGQYYNAMKGIGRWRGISEESIILELYGDPPNGFEENLEKLRVKLGQESIMVAVDRADMVLADGSEGWTIKNATTEEMQSNLDAMIQMAKVITQLQGDVTQLELGMEEMNPAQDYICAKCGAVEQWNFFWGEFFSKPFRCSKCGSTEYKES
jgi:hypothetical protein